MNVATHLGIILTAGLLDALFGDPVYHSSQAPSPSTIQSPTIMRYDEGKTRASLTDPMMTPMTPASVAIRVTGDSHRPQSHASGIPRAARVDPVARPVVGTGTVRLIGYSVPPGEDGSRRVRPCW
ncbi:hypothetical protein [uncultured Lamprocystis sp.]|jgi:hypothetical protein|uniref:hypothetical protein n=1 Tax=uncultured Lamprocystis sp. TaxID=543132 RepID=UPI0025FDCEB3|nr:hypothetical protein [uncultured Lamprocystis sp.]